MSAAATEILSELARRGVRVRVEGDSLKLKPKSALDDILLARVREHKPEILTVLEGKGRAACGSPDYAGCYSIGVFDGRERFIHPPKPSPDWLDWLKRWERKGPTQ